MNENTSPTVIRSDRDTAPTKTRRLLRWGLIAGLVAMLVASAYWYRTRPGETKYITAPATQGNVVKTIVTTGTINPLVTVQVGAYVSGTVQKLYCDYNTKVKAGQLCAKIDPRPFQVLVDQNAANLASAQAQLKKDQASLTYARINYNRDKGLLKSGIVSQDTVDNDKSVLDQAEALVGVDQATIKQRQAALDAARVNLDYTDIISPVDGTVISRSIDVGQTVASSFQTPTLFLIAKDLTQMQVDTNVSETDVGRAVVGQKALFTVEAFPERTFEGKVAQVRQSPITVQNVVTYDVVIAVTNPDLLLFPGMTANTRIVTAERSNVLRVPVQALRFSLQQKASRPDAEQAAGRQRGERVYVLRNGVPQRVAVTAGLSDGAYVEVSGEGLGPDDQVVVNEVRAGGDSKGAAPQQRPALRF